MRFLQRPHAVPGMLTQPTRGRRKPSDEREAEIEMFRVLLAGMKKRHAWDRIKGAIATGIPTFWIVLILLGPYVPSSLSGSFPGWIADPVRPLLANAPAPLAVAISLAIAGFQWYNIAYYQRRVIPLVRAMYERALTKRDPRLLTMLGDALRFRTLRESFRNGWRRLFAN